MVQRGAARAKSPRPGVTWSQHEGPCAWGTVNGEKGGSVAGSSPPGATSHNEELRFSRKK